MKNAYFYGDLDEEIYMDAPKGMDIPEGKVLWLHKALYGLKQAGRAWYQKLQSVMKKFGLKQVPCEPHLFVTQKIVKSKALTLILPIYVDDIFLIGDKYLTDQFEHWIGDYLDITILGDASLFLGIRTIRNRTAQPPFLTLDQEHYTLAMLHKHNVNLEKRSNYLISTLGANYIERSEDELKATSEEIRKYQSLIGSLMYLMLGTQPDIAYAVSRFAHFAHNPSKDHFKAVGRTFAYVNATARFAIQYTKSNKDDIDPFGVCDADYAGELSARHRRKSTSGSIFFVAGGAVSWSSKLQKVHAVSTMEAEYISLYTTGKQAAWIRQIYEAIGFPLANPIYVYCDNKAAISAANKEGTHEAKKYIDIKYHYIQELVEDDKIQIEHTETESNEADILTKCLTGKVFGDKLCLIGFAHSQEFLISIGSLPSSFSPPSFDTLNLDTSNSTYTDTNE